ncbi:hypothetical protein [Microbacterium sp. Marseille-Q6965]|uniref:hypothetical protein n=1 Tax=Microbacterium sp. Marseille-Q6965 TaxID=2965072 RepID=UPI0021B7D07C|nr:hypothetical protein [Microbacterium sp. Marseille-Q6965]
MSYAAHETTSEYTARRIRIETNAHFDAFVSAFESAVPALPEAEAAARVAEDGDWAAFVRGVQWESPSGFVSVWSSRPDRIMQSAGSDARSAVWLIVHHGVAARMFRHDAGTTLYSPIRVEAHTGREPGTVLGVEVPSAPLASYGINKVAQAGAELDRALGDLLEDLGLPRPTALRR